jgi:hypothetical protein
MRTSTPTACSATRPATSRATTKTESAQNSRIGTITVESA